MDLLVDNAHVPGKKCFLCTPKGLDEGAQDWLLVEDPFEGEPIWTLLILQRGDDCLSGLEEQAEGLKASTVRSSACI